MELLLQPNLAAWSQLILAVVEEGAKLVIAKVLANSLHEDYVVLGPSDDLAEIQGISKVCLTDLDARLFLGVLQIVRIAVHDIDLVLGEALA